MSIVCEKKGHDYYQGTRKVNGWLVPTEETILYCGRCGDIIPIDVPYQAQPVITTTTYSISWRWWPNDNSSWTMLLCNTSS